MSETIITESSMLSYYTISQCNCIVFLLKHKHFIFNFTGTSTIEADLQIVYIGDFQEADMVGEVLFYYSLIVTHSWHFRLYLDSFKATLIRFLPSLKRVLFFLSSDILIFKNSTSSKSGRYQNSA